MEAGRSVGEDGGLGEAMGMDGEKWTELSYVEKNG